MKRHFIHISVLGIFLLAVLEGCSHRPAKINRRISLWRQDKIPYGTFYAYEGLSYLFPDAEISINKNSPAESPAFGLAAAGSAFFQGHHKAYIVIVPRFVPTQREINVLMNFVGEGNQLFISSFYFSDSLLASLKLKLGRDQRYQNERYSLRVSVASPVTSDTLRFDYPGFSGDNYVRELDSQYTTVLGWDRDGRPDFVKFGYKGGGALFLHFAPIALTNYFLLHAKNKAYYDNVFSYLPPTVSEVRWDEYFRYPKTGFSSFAFLMSNRSFRWAVWLTLFLFGMIYLFESKRRQRMVAAGKPLRNSSLDFVMTIGRLYYQQGDQANLASKMITHFLDHVRSRYQLSTQTLDQEFEERLSYKSGYSREGIAALIGMVRHFQDNAPQRNDLLTFNQKLEDFYTYGKDRR